MTLLSIVQPCTQTSAPFVRVALKPAKYCPVVSAVLQQWDEYRRPASVAVSKPRPPEKNPPMALGIAARGPHRPDGTELRIQRRSWVECSSRVIGFSHERRVLRGSLPASWFSSAQPAIL